MKTSKNAVNINWKKEIILFKFKGKPIFTEVHFRGSEIYFE